MSEDLVQSVFIQLWENNKITQLDSPEPYLIKCVRYKCIDYLKTPFKKNAILSSDLPDIHIQTEYALEEKDILALLHFFADKLPPKMRQVFLMSRTNGLSYKEISEELDISVKTVENQMGAALKKMRSLLRDHHYLSLIAILLQ